MFELLVRLECEGEALRRRLLKSSVRYGNSYFAIALIVFAASLMTGPLEIIAAPAVALPLIPVFFLGLFLVLSIVFLPYGLIVW